MDTWGLGRPRTPGRDSSVIVAPPRCLLLSGPPAFDRSGWLAPAELHFCNQFAGLRVQFQRLPGRRRAQRGLAFEVLVLLARSLPSSSLRGRPSGALMTGSEAQVKGPWRVLHRFVPVSIPGNPSGSPQSHHLGVYPKPTEMGWSYSKEIRAAESAALL